MHVQVVPVVTGEKAPRAQKCAPAALTQRIPGERIRFGLGEDVDFRIACAGPGDVTVKLVRVIKLLPPRQEQSSPQAPDCLAQGRK